MSEKARRNISWLFALKSFRLPSHIPAIVASLYRVLFVQYYFPIQKVFAIDDQQVRNTGYK